MTRLAKFFARDPAQRRLLLEAAWWLALSRLAIRFLPFRRIAPHLGRRDADNALTATPLSPEQQARLPAIAWAVAAAARHVPWQAVCLPQAMAAKTMLRRRGIPSTLFLGLRKPGEFSAHAWLQAGGHIVTGRQAAAEHVVVASFT